MPTAAHRLARARALESMVRDIARAEILPRYLNSARNRKADGSLFTEADMASQQRFSEALPAFLSHCNQRIGAAYFQTPRNTVRAFLDLLSVLEQHADLDWNHLIEELDVSQELNTDRDIEEDGTAPAPAAVHAGAADPDDELSSFRL